MIRCIIVDDEPYCCEALDTLLGRYCPALKVVDICHNGKSALDSIEEFKPQVVFLDIEMPQMNGFQMLEKINNIEFELIFTTSYDQFAIKAIRTSALDYLLKPIDREELQIAVHRAMERLQYPQPQQIEILFHKLGKGTGSLNKIALPTMDGLQMICFDQIIHIQAEGNYSVLTLKDRQKITISRTLKETEEILEDYPFARVHHSHLVNLNEVEKYIKGEGGYLMMSNGSTIDVSRSRKEVLLTRLQPNRISS